MLKCSPEAFAKCQIKCHHCETADKAYFLEGSDCDKFNQEVLAAPKTRADLVRAMNDEDLADHHCKFVASVLDRMGYSFDKEKFKIFILDWLQQIVGVE